MQFTPDFILVVKHIFNREKAKKTAKSFVNKQDNRLRVVHVEVREEQALEVTSAISKMIKSLAFQANYDMKVYFSAQLEFSQNNCMQIEIK